METALTPDELTRYARQLVMPGFGLAGQVALKRARVLVIGAGGLGSPALLHLAAAGVGHITLMDPDAVEVSNLQRQILFTTADAGQPKALVAARRLRALNPHISIEPRAERLNRDNALALVAAHDLVLDGSDNFATRYLVNDACVIARRPFVYGAIQGFTGQISVFNHRPAPKQPAAEQVAVTPPLECGNLSPFSTECPVAPPTRQPAAEQPAASSPPPTYRCLFPEPPPPEDAPSCAEAGVLGVLPGIIGALQAAEAIKVLTGIGEPLSGKLLLINVLTMTSRVLTFPADPANQNIRELPPDPPQITCPLNPTPNPTDEITPGELHRLDKPPQFIDVRENWERLRDGPLFQDSIHIPLNQLTTPDAERILAQFDKTAPTVVHCAKGVRSLKALPILRSLHGFRNIKSLRPAPPS